MKKIVVPVDFSQASEAAVSFAQTLGGKLEIVHVIDVEPTESTLHNWKKLHAEKMKTGKEQAQKLLKKIDTKNVVFKLLTGIPFDEILINYGKKTKADLIVMGTQGSTGLKKVVLGSNAADILNTSPLPVIVVPKDASFKGIKKIVYASDLKHLDEEAKTIVHFAKPLEAEVVILHVAKKEKKKDHNNLLEILTRMTKYSNIRFNIVHNEDTVLGIEDGVKSEKPDLLAMFTHKLGSIEKVMGLGTTRKFAFKNTLPLLSINRSKVE